MIDTEEMKRILDGRNIKEKISYISMIGRTMINLNENSKKNIQQVIDVLVDRVLVEENNEVKENIYMELYNIVNLNKRDLTKVSIERLINKLELLNDDDLVEALMVISATWDLEYLDLMKKYTKHDNKCVKEMAKEVLLDMEVLKKEKKE